MQEDTLFMAREGKGTLLKKDSQSKHCFVMPLRTMLQVTPFSFVLKQAQTDNKDVGSPQVNGIASSKPSLTVADNNARAQAQLVNVPQSPKQLMRK